MTGNVKGRLGIRIRSEIDSRQREFTDGNALHHLATSMPPRTKWAVNSGPVHNKDCPSGHHASPALDRGRSRTPLE